MIRITQLKMSIEEDPSLLRQKIASILKLGKSVEFTYHIHKRNIDARKKEEIYFVYTVDVSCAQEKNVLKRRFPNVSRAPIISRKPLEKGINYLKNPPIIVGFGPAGMFSALLLAQYGFCPIVLERGESVENRSKKVNTFFKEAILDEESNIQFGEGGAGTFSDGKLTARSKDVRVQKIYDVLTHFGAPKEISYESHPHLGSDRLKGIIKNIRNEIIRLGGEIHFNSKVEQLIIENNQIKGVQTKDKTYASNLVLLALGNSARDSVQTFYKQGIAMEAKPMAIGFRIEHKQDFINQSMYHKYASHPSLQAASYRLAHQSAQGKGIYTFCMCPGGSVVAATSLKNRVVVNGMSNYARNEDNANSAILVQIDESDYGNDIFDGMNYLDRLERKAFEFGGSNYQAPCQSVQDYLNNKLTMNFKEVNPTYPIGVKFANLNELFSEDINRLLKEGIRNFNQKIKGFSDESAIITGVETRSSSFIRILRDKKSLQSINTIGLYPCGEGAGYAGGIISSAIDGFKCAEEIIQNYNYDK